jgi:hypothetical protein
VFARDASWRYETFALAKESPGPEFCEGFRFGLAMRWLNRFLFEPEKGASRPCIPLEIAINFR